MRHALPYALTFLAGLAVGAVVLSGGGKRHRQPGPADTFSVSVPVPGEEWKRVYCKLTICRIIHPDGEVVDIGPSQPDTKFHVVTVAGTTYCGVPVVE